MNVTKDATWSAFAERRVAVMQNERTEKCINAKETDLKERKNRFRKKNTHTQQSVVRTRCGHPFDLVCLDMFSFFFIIIIITIIICRRHQRRRRRVYMCSFGRKSLKDILRKKFKVTFGIFVLNLKKEAKDKKTSIAKKKRIKTERRRVCMQRLMHTFPFENFACLFMI